MARAATKGPAAPARGGESTARDGGLIREQRLELCYSSSTDYMRQTAAMVKGIRRLAAY